LVLEIPRDERLIARGRGGAVAGIARQCGAVAVLEGWTGIGAG
jgi:hypothetical protein